MEAVSRTSKRCDNGFILKVPLMAARAKRVKLELHTTKEDGTIRWVHFYNKGGRAV
jgi:hypothetical protein